MLKICSPQLGISQISNLGGEIYDYQTLKGFTLEGFKVLVFLPKGRVYDEKLENFKVAFAPFKHIFPPWIYSFLMLPYLIKTYRQEKFDILRIHSPRFIGLGALIFYHFFSKVPILTSAVTVDSSSFYYPIEKWVYKTSKAIIVQSEYMKRLLAREYQLDDHQKIHVTYGGQLEGSRYWHELPPEASLIGEKDKVLLFMGAMIERKNPLFVLDVFSRLNKSRHNLKLVFIGQGNLKKTLQQKVKVLSLEDKVIFIDRAFGNDKNYWFSRMNLFLFPSLNEGFGLVVTEAMSFGKVVLVSDKAAFPEIVENGVDGFCLPLNVKKWSETADNLLSNQKIQKRIARMAKKKGSKRVQLAKNVSSQYSGY